ncbi:MAG: type II toxin-antitoxin system VapC family toxin [Rhodospirillaceae bacterium]|nr:type II toxin-antitoxin system VapC family toxin [Rhodospirillaceae bacterium]
MSLVLDASMAITWFFADEKSAMSDRVLTQVTDDGAVVPSLWKLEVANMLRTAVRRKRCTEAHERNCLRRLGDLPIIIDAETDIHAWDATRELSVDHDLTIYDAAYLELAMRRKIPLATCDAALAVTARRLKLEVLSP